MAAMIGVWFVCDLNGGNSFDDTHKSRILETECNRMITSQHKSGGTNSEIDAADWAKGDPSRPRMIPGQTRATSYPYYHLYAAHRYPPNHVQYAEESYNSLKNAGVLGGIEGFVVYHEAPSPGRSAEMKEVMERVRDLYRGDTGKDPELYAIAGDDPENGIPNRDVFFNNFWWYSKGVFVSEKYCWSENWKNTEKPMVEFEKCITNTADTAKAKRTSQGWPCRWTAIVGAHTDTYQGRNYYTPDEYELRYTFLLPVALGADGVAYFVFDWASWAPCTDDIFRNSTTRQNISNLKPRINWLKTRLEPYSNPGYSGYKYNTTNGGWQSFPESDWLDRIQENQGDNTSWQKKLLVAFWKGYTGHEAWPITSRDPWTGNYSYTAYFKKETHVIWDGNDKGNLTQFPFTMSPGDTKLLELWPTMW